MARKSLIQIRRDTAANWTSTNPVLAAGEQGYETDTGFSKIGDGATAWASLAYERPKGQATVFNVRDYEAVGDGVTNNAVFIQTAADDAEDDELFLPAGEFYMADDLTLRGSLRGVGAASKLIFAEGKGIVISSVTNQNLQDFYVDTSSHVANNKAIYVLNSNDIHIERVIAPDCGGFGVFVSADATNITSRIWIRDCYLRGNGVNDVIGGGPNSTSSHVQDVFVSGCRVVQDCTVNDYDNAIDLVRVEYSLYTGNNTNGSIAFGHEASPHKLSSISDNNIRPAVGTDECYISVVGTTVPVGRIQGVTIANNRLQTGGIVLTGSSSAVAFEWAITSNTLIDAPEYGIALTDVQYGVVSGNIIQGANNAISLISASNNIFSNNVISDAGLGIKSLFSDYNTFTLNNMQNGVVTKFSGLGDNDVIFSNQGVNPTGLMFNAGSSGSAITVDRIDGDFQTITISADSTITLSDALAPGDTIRLALIQDATGGWDITWSSNVKLAGGALAISPIALSVGIVSFVWDSIYWREIGRSADINSLVANIAANTAAINTKSSKGFAIAMSVAL